MTQEVAFSATTQRGSKEQMIKRLLKQKPKFVLAVTLKNTDNEFAKKWTLCNSFCQWFYDASVFEDEEDMDPEVVSMYSIYEKNYLDCCSHIFDSTNEYINKYKDLFDNKIEGRHNVIMVYHDIKEDNLLDFYKKIFVKLRGDIIHIEGKYIS